jgi:leucyl aminopeptidase
VEEVLVVSRPSKEIQEGVRKGKIIGTEINNTRILANTPGGDMTPSRLAEAAFEAVDSLPVKVEVLGVDQMHELGMGAILGVGKGSADAPRFIIMEYFAGDAAERPVVLVGKGVTFDTGGLNLKSSEGIYEMHMDMSGGAAVIHAVALAARLKLKRNIVGLVPAVENMPSGSSYRPGDVLRSMSGKTIEVLNTDAEGRIILADALHYAKRYKPALVVDVATLTGAAMVALGNKASAIFTKDRSLEESFRKWGEESGDYVWPLPLWEEYEADIKGTFGDWANVGKGKMAGAIAGAIFLYQWAKEYPWVHIDMAPRMTPSEGEYLAKGATGAPVRLLWKILERFEG